MTEPATIHCPRCAVDVPADKVNPPAPYVRCTDHRCPLHTAEQNEELKASWERTRA